MDKKLLSKGFQGVLDKDKKSLKMKLYYVLNFNTEILSKLLVVVSKEMRKC